MISVQQANGRVLDSIGPMNATNTGPSGARHRFNGRRSFASTRAIAIHDLAWGGSGQQRGLWPP